MAAHPEQRRPGSPTNDPIDSVDHPAIDSAIDSALQWADQDQQAEGFWAGMLESNACMEAEWLLAFHILGYEYPHSEALVRGILARQRADGSWESYFNAPSGDINATVEAYAALRASGIGPDDAGLVKARQWIFSHGGLRQTRVFTRIWLALIGEWPWQHTPNLPPEIIAMPLWSPFNIYHFATWARATLVPIAVLSARRHVRPLGAQSRLDELFPEGRDAFDYRLIRRGKPWSWNGFFIAADRILHGLQSLRLTPGRRRAVRQCVDWIARHQDADGAWGGIQPPWIYSLMALHAEGRPLTDPVMARGLSALDAHWSYERDDCRYIQASESPVWDTLLMLQGMLDCERDAAGSPGIRNAVDWLLANEVRQRGDWTVKVRNIEPGGWAFERANAHYPDVDDTAVAVLVLSRLQPAFDESVGIDPAVQRAVRWMTAMQSRNGGWAAFDKDNDGAILAEIPFSDFGETLDPASADVTAHVLEALAATGRDMTDPVVARGLAFLRREQEPGGSWFGRWGVNHIYGTAAVLPALHAIGEDMSSAYVRRAANWVIDHQNADGGWGESCASYMDPTQIGKGVSTASQTSWALMALLAVSETAYEGPVRRGIEFLCRHQTEGTWAEPEYTGTGFPGYGLGARTDLADPELSHRLQQGEELQRGFLINYNLYRHYFPLSALGRYRRIQTRVGRAAD
jgi:squalene-hopene/tetraprenyl-beta-curcumene cyclase